MNVRLDEDFRMDLGVCMDEATRCVRLLRDFLLTVDRECKCISPATRSRWNAEARGLNALDQLLSVVLQSWKVEAESGTEVRVAARVCAHEIRESLAADYRAMVQIRTRPWTDCQIYLGRSESQSAHHAGTGLQSWRGFGSSTDYCHGPLRTDEEIRLGMCGSCLNKYGSVLGIEKLAEETSHC